MQIICQPVFADDIDEQARAIYKDVLCAVCNNGQSIAESEVEMAKSMRITIKEQLKAGRTRSEIEQFLTQRYGDQIVARPPFNPHTVILWLAPALVLMASLIIWWRLHKLSRLNMN